MGRYVLLVTACALLSGPASAQAWKNCIPNSIAPGGCDSIAPGGGKSIAPGGGLSIAPGGGLSIAPGGGQSIAPGGGLSIAPGGGLAIDRNWNRGLDTRTMRPAPRNGLMPMPMMPQMPTLPTAPDFDDNASAGNGAVAVGALLGLAVNAYRNRKAAEAAKAKAEADAVCLAPGGLFATALNAHFECIVRSADGMEPTGYDPGGLGAVAAGSCPATKLELMAQAGVCGLRGGDDVVDARATLVATKRIAAVREARKIPAQ